MKFEPNKHYTTIAVYAFGVIAAAILFLQAMLNFGSVVSFFRDLSGYIQPVIYGFVFAYLLNPLLRMLDDRFLPWISKGKLRAKTRRAIAIALTYPIAIIFVAVFIAIVVPQLRASVEILFDNGTTYIGALNRFYTNIMDSMYNYQLLSEGTESEAFIGNGIAIVIGTVEGLLAQLVVWLDGIGPMILSGATKVTTGLYNVVLGIIVSIYFLFDREKLFAQLHKITTALFPKKACDLFYDVTLDAHKIFSGFINGKVIDSIIIGILCFIGMSLLRMPNAPLISVIVGVTNIIPYFGPFIGAIPSFLIIVIESPRQAFWFLVFVLFLQQLDGNIIGPKILGDTTGLSALWVIFSIMLFSGLMGIPGMFVGVPVFAFIYSLLKRFFAYLLARKNMPTNTRAYESKNNPLIK